MVDFHLATAAGISARCAASQFHACRRSAVHHTVRAERVDPGTGAPARIQALRSDHPPRVTDFHGNQLLTVVRGSVDELDAAMSRIAQTAKEASQTFVGGAGLLHAANIFRERLRNPSRRPDVQSGCSTPI